MPSAHDFQILASRDHQVCLKVEEDFPDEYAVSAATYHIQQAVEKQLKALLLLHGETPEFTHSILKLADRCQKCGIALPEALDDISEALTLWETASRYDPFVAFSQKKYEKAKTVYMELDQTLSRMLSEIHAEPSEDESEEETPKMGM